MGMAQEGKVGPEEIRLWVPTKGQRNNSGLLGVAQELTPSSVHVLLGEESLMLVISLLESYNNTRKHGAGWECSMGAGEPAPVHAQRTAGSRGHMSRT